MAANISLWLEQNVLLEVKHGFQTLDYVVFGVSLTLSLAIGLFFACLDGRQTTVSEYVHGDRKMHLLPVAMSVAVSYVSAVSILGFPAHIYAYGVNVYSLYIGFTWAAVLAAVCIVPVFYNLGVVSIFEYLHIRFDSGTTRVIGSLINLIAELAYAGVTIYGPALVVEEFMGLRVWVSMAAIVLLSTIYTSLGGLKAVVWVDTFQALVILGTMLSVSVVGLIQIGSLQTFWRHLEDGGRLHVNIDPDPRQPLSVWAGVVGFGMQTLSMLTGQTTIQRCSSLPSLSRARWCVIIGLITYLLLSSVSTTCGAIAFAYYRHLGCDPLLAGHIKNPNQIVPYFVQDVMRLPGISGLFVACLFSAVLSTVSSIQNGLSANVWIDLLQPCCKHLTDATRTAVMKVIVLVLGGVALALGFVASIVPGTLLLLSAMLYGLLLGPRLGLFLLGLAAPHTGSKATNMATMAGLALVVSGAVIAWLDPIQSRPLETTTMNCSMTAPNSSAVLPSGESNGGVFSTAASLLTASNSDSPDLGPREPQFYHISPFYYSLVGTAITFIIGILLGLIPGLRARAAPDPDYLFACCRRCGADTEDDDYKDMKQLNNEYTPKPSPFLDTSRMIHREMSGMQHEALVKQQERDEAQQRRDSSLQRREDEWLKAISEKEIVEAKESCV